MFLLALLHESLALGRIHTINTLADCPGSQTRTEYDVDVTLTSCTFNQIINGTTSCMGGAIYVKQSRTLKIDQCKFTDVIVSGPFSSGGAVYAFKAQTEFLNSEFTNCSSMTKGGAIFNIKCTKTDVTGCTFTKCSSNAASACKIQYDPDTEVPLRDSVNFKSSAFIECFHKDAGDTDDFCTLALDFDGETTIIQANVINCTFKDLKEFAILCECSMFSLNNSAFSNVVNLQQDHSSCVHCLLKSISTGLYYVSDTTFDKCVTQDYGMMNIPNVALSMINCVISNCIANDTDNVNAHGLMITDNDVKAEDVTIKNCAFTDNDCSNGGSGLYVDRNSVNLTIDSCTFTNNKVTNSKGSAYGASLHSKSSGIITILNTKFHYIKVNDATSVVFQGKPTVSISSSCFNSTGTYTNNTFHIISSVPISFSKVCYNKVTGPFNFASGQSWVNITTNCAECQPYDECPKDLTKRTEVNRKSLRLFKCGFHDIIIPDSESSLTQGGALFLSTGEFYIIECTFVHIHFNTKYGQGGAISFGSSTSTIVKYCNFYDCLSVESGGAIYSSMNDHDTIIEYCDFQYCQSKNASAIRIDYGTSGLPGQSASVIINYCNFQHLNMTEVSTDKDNNDYYCSVSLDFAGEIGHEPATAVINNCVFQDIDEFAVLLEITTVDLNNTYFHNVKNPIENHASCVHCLLQSINADGQYRIINTTFESCTTNDFGVMNIPFVNLTMESCTYKQCTAYDKDGKDAHTLMITDDATGGKLEEIIINDCLFDRCKSSNGGAGIYIDRETKTIFMTRCTFTGCQVTNKALENAGISLHVTNKGTIDMQECIFKATRSLTDKSTNLYFKGLDSITMIFCSIETNVWGTLNSSHAICHIISDKKITFEGFNCYNKNGDGSRDFSISGFTLPNDKTLTSTCKDNVPTEECENKRIEIKDDYVHLYKCDFSNIKSTIENTKGGAICVIYEGSSSWILLQQCHFNNIVNTVGKSACGGAVYTIWCNNTIIDCTFEQCSVTQYGGACDLEYPVVGELVRTQFVSCFADYCSCVKFNFNTRKQDPTPGDLYFEAHITGCSFENCMSYDNLTDYSCALALDYVDSDSDKIAINASIIDTLFNQIDESFAVLSECKYMVIIRTTFEDITNNVQNRASCIYCLTGSISSGNYIIHDTTFSNCRTEDYGVVNIPNVGLDMRNCNFLRIISLDSDQNVFAHGLMITDNDDILEPVVLENCTFASCMLGNGGALFIDRKEKDVLISNCVFNSNTVKDENKNFYGCNIHVSQNGSIAIVGCKFNYVKRTSPASSVAIYDVYKCIFYKCCFNSIGAFTSCGHIQSNMKVEFYPDNCFNDLGDKNFLWRGEAPTTLNNVHFNCKQCIPVAECKRERYEVRSALLNLQSCQFDNMIAKESEGGVLYIKDGKLIVNDCTFINCQALSGGAIFSEDSETTISSSSFISGIASEQAGCVMLLYPNVSTVTDSSFSLSQAFRVATIMVDAIPDYDPNNDFEEIPAVTVFERCQFNDNKVTSTMVKDDYCAISFTFTGFYTVLNTTFLDCVIKNQDNQYNCYGIYCKATYLTLNNTLFERCTNVDAEGRASCVYCPTEVIHFGHYWLDNTTFTYCETTDYGVMNVPNVILTMINSKVYRCSSYDSDERKNAHGFMITDDDNYIQKVEITNCTFEETKNVNGGALFIDRSLKRVVIEGCKFYNNVFSDDEKAYDGGGANLHVTGSGGVYVHNCEFQYKKRNNATSVWFQGLTNIEMTYCCFKSEPQASPMKFVTAFNIFSDTTIVFRGDICMNNNTQNGINNQFANGQDTSFISYKCGSTCIPIEDCGKNERVEYKSQKISLNKCSYERTKTTGLNGGKFYDESSYIILNGCFFDGIDISATANSQGGACYLIGCVSIIKDCHFYWNRAVEGGALFIIYPISSYLENCEFDGNFAVNKSAALYLERSIFTPAKAKSMRSAEWYPGENDASDVYQIIKCKFTSNTVSPTAPSSISDYRCCISLDYLSEMAANFTAIIKDCLFSDIDTSFAILCESGYLELTNTEFLQINCQVQGHSSVLHSVLDSVAEGRYLIHNITCAGCDTEDFGLMNIPNVIVDMKDCYFHDCEAKDSDKHIEGHGIMITDSDNKMLEVNIENVTFIGMSSAGGGALFINRASKRVVIKNCLFRSNNVLNSESAGVGANLHVEGSKTGSVKITGCKFDFVKTVKGTSSVYFNESHSMLSIQMDKCCFESTVSVKDDEKPIHIFSNRRISFGVDCCCNYIFGLMFEVNGVDPSEYFSTNCDKDCVPLEICYENKRYEKSNQRLNVQNCSFRGMTIGSDKNGCAIYVSKGLLIVKYCTFSNVNGAKEGGAIYTLNSEARIIGTKFIKCVSTTSGGAIMSSYTNYTIVQDCQFSMCTSQRGSAVWIYILPDDGFGENDYFETPKNASVIGCTFRDCTHSEKPQEGYIDYYCTLAVDFEDSYTVADLILTDTTFQDNTGFGMLSEASFMTIKNVLFKNIRNDQQKHSACIHCLVDTVHFGLYTLYNVTFSRCTTEDYGVMNVPNVGLDMNNCTVSYCTSTDSDEHINAHGFMITDTDFQTYNVNIRNCLFEYNEGANGGAGLYIDRMYKDVTIESCQFNYNSASYTKDSAKYGVNIHATMNGRVNVTNCKFVTQKKNDAASVLFSQLDDVILMGNCFTTSSWDWETYTSAFHIVSDKVIKLIGIQCFNNKTGMVMFNLPSDQKYTGVVTNCDEYCVPSMECPTSREPIVTSDDCNIQKCTFKDLIYSGQNDGGGAIYLNQIGLIMRDCKFTNVSATSTSGGAVYILSAQLIIYDSSFVLCKAGNNGGAIFCSSPVKVLVENTLFEECDAPKVSAAHIQYQYMTLVPTDLTTIFKGCTIQSMYYRNLDKATDYDCCIAVDIFNDFNPDDDNENDAILDDFYINGTFIDCYFTGNDRFCIFTEAANLTVVNTAFENINYNNYNQQNHSCCIHCSLELINYGVYYLKNVSAVLCYTNDYGFMNVPNVKLEMYDCVISNLQATDSDGKDGHGLMITDNDNKIQNVNIYNCEFSMIATLNGGAVYIDRAHKNIAFENCKFDNNAVRRKLDDYMGVNIMSVGSGDIRLTGCVFNYRKIVDVASIALKDLTSFYVEGCCFNAEVLSQENLNGVYIKSTCEVNFLKNNCYTEVPNAFNYTGFVNPGEPYLYTNCYECQPLDECYNFTKLQNLVDTQVYLRECRFFGVANEDNGGCINALRTTIKIEECNFGVCMATSGSCVYVTESTLYMTNCYINFVTAESSAAVYSKYPVETIFTGNIFKECYAKFGAAIRMTFTPDYDPDNDNEEIPQNVNITSCSFLQCSVTDKETAEDRACIISLDAEQSATVLSANFINSSIQNADTFGILSELSYLRIENSRFDRIVAKMQGHASAVHCLPESVRLGYYYIINTTFTELTTQDYGVMNVPNVALDMDNVNISDCYSYDDDEHKHAHGFMITDDDDLLLDIMIQNCIFKNNEAQNGGAGLFIDRIAKYVYINNCQFLMNRATYNASAADYGANLQVHNGGLISISDTKFNFEKTNKASNVFFKGLDQIYMMNCCFKSTGSAVDNTPFHINSDKVINFNGYSCFNDMKDNFKFADGQSQNYISFKCQDFCTPVDTCPSSRLETYGQKIVLYKCSFENRIDDKENQQGGVIRMTGGVFICDSCLFTSCQLTGSGSNGGALYLDYSTSTVTNCKFIRCASKHAGGAIDVEMPEKAEFRNNIFSYCVSTRASGIKANYKTFGDNPHQVIYSIEVESCTFKDCYHHSIEDSDYYCALALDFDGTTAIVNGSIINCVFKDLKGFGVLSECSYMTLTNTIFQNIVNDQQNHCSCVHCLVRSISFGKYTILNTSFLDCVTEDFGVFNMPNVGIDMQDCQVLRCISKDSDRHVDAHGFMITDDDSKLTTNIIKNCVFEANEVANGGAGLYIDRYSASITVISCKFLKNKVTYTANSKNYGVNVHVVGTGASNIRLNFCKFVTDKDNDASSIRFEGVGSMSFNSSCFTTNGDGFKTPYHIVSTVINNFYGTNCFNDQGEYNFNFTKVTKNTTFSFECAENCIPYSYCPIMGRYPNSTNTIINLVKCDIIGHSVSGEDGKNGGAIYCSHCQLYLTSCSFQSCTALESGANGGAVYLKIGSTLEVVDTKFTSCEANNIGGAIYNLAPISTSFTDCMFIRCTSQHTSSVKIAVPGDEDKESDFDDKFTISFTNCFFKENNATGTNPEGLCTLNVDDSSNSAEITTIMRYCRFVDMSNYGMFSENSYLTLEHCIFQNLDNTLCSGRASGIHCDLKTVSYGKYVIHNTTFIGLESDDFGVMNVPNVALIMTQVTVKNCKSYDSDEHINAHGFMITDDDEAVYPVFIQNCVFESNDAANGGAGLYIDRLRKDVTIVDCQFLNNVASYTENSDQYGINLQVIGIGSINVTKCKFVCKKENKAVSVRFTNLTRIIMDTCCFKTEGYQSNSGAYHVYSNTYIYFYGTTCANKRDPMFELTKQEAPAVDTKCDDFCVPNLECPTKRKEYSNVIANIQKCQFTDVISTGMGVSGGAIRVSNGILYIRDTYFSGCQVKGMSSSGGAVYAIRTEVHVFGSRFATCTAYTHGGAVESVFPNVTEFQDCIFARCSAKRASAIHTNIYPDYNEDDDEFETKQEATFIGCTFRENYHGSSTGEGYEDYYCTVSVDFDQEFTSLKAVFKDTTFWGSKEFAILSEASDLYIENTAFIGITNDIQGHASCVHCLTDTVHFGTYVIKNTSFINCVTEDYGVMNVPNVALNMSEVTVFGCNSTDSDEHLHAHGFMITDNDDLMLPIFITNCVFESNDAANGGAGLFIDRKAKNIILTECTFRNNKASYQADSSKYGANLQVEGSGKISITKCKFIYTKTNDACNAMFQGLDEIILDNNCFVSNGNGNTPFHIVSNTIITFTGIQHCFNQKGNYNFQFASGQNIPDTVKYTCDEFCIPADQCPTDRTTKTDGILNLFKCTFTGTRSQTDGAVAYLRECVLNIIDSTFNDCYSNNRGGVIFANEGEIHIYNSRFNGCEGRLYSGAINGLSQKVYNIDNCVFSKCRSKRISAVQVAFVPDYEPGNDEEEIQQNASITNCQFIECYNTDNEKYYLDYYCVVGLDFDQESTVANASVVNCSFNNNMGFGILSELTYLQLINTTFVKQNNDKAGNHASCVHCLTETVHFGQYIIKNTTFSECVTDDFGVMNVPNVLLDMRDCLVYKCTSTDVDGNITGHGFMITDDDDLLEQISVTNCVFEQNNCANGGALFINRKLKNVVIENCQFMNNKATFDSKADTYGANLQVEGSGTINLITCKFIFDKTNKATSIRLQGLDMIILTQCCFKTTATSKEGYYHIWADKPIDFIDFVCFNSIDDIEDDSLSRFAEEQLNSTFSFNCDDHCIPITECPTTQFTSYDGSTVNIQKCNFNDIAGPIINTMGGKLIIRETKFNPKQTESVSKAYCGASAIWATNTDMFIYDCQFNKCIVGEDAGAVGTVLSNITHFERCTFTECANKLVAAVYLNMIEDDDASNDEEEIPKLGNFTECTFTKCSHPSFDKDNAKFYCTVAAYTETTTTVVNLILTKCTIEEIQGFGIMTTASFLTLDNTVFKNIKQEQQDYASCVHCPPENVHFGAYTLKNTQFVNCSTQDYGVMNVPNVGLFMTDCTVKSCSALDSDQSVNGHGFMITDNDDLLYPCYIENCKFEDNDGANGGAGLYIDRKQKSVFISNCQFSNNKASHDEGSQDYGVNLQVIGTGIIDLYKCTFNFVKTNKAASTLFANLNQINIDSCTFNSDGTGDTPFHIVADTLITFKGTSCMNNKGNLNFKFADGQTTNGINFNCGGGGGGDDDQNQGGGSGGISGGALAGIIIAVVLIIAIAAVAVVVFIIKKGVLTKNNQDSDIYHADKEVSYSEAMSTATFETANAEHVFDDEL